MYAGLPIECTFKIINTFASYGKVRARQNDVICYQYQSFIMVLSDGYL